MWGWTRTLPTSALDAMAPQAVEAYRRDMKRSAAQRHKTFAVLDHLHDNAHIDVVIHGDAAGADRLAQVWAERAKVLVERYPARWDVEGRAAGPIRNTRMLIEGRPDLVVAFPGGHGTANMIGQAIDHGVRVMDLKI